MKTNPDMHLQITVRGRIVAVLAQEGFELDYADTVARRIEQELGPELRELDKRRIEDRPAVPKFARQPASKE